MQDKGNQSFGNLAEVFHKEKNQKKYNKTTGQNDKLKKYSKPGNSARGKSTTSDKLIRREANYLKNIHIDETYQKLVRMNCITDLSYEAFWCGVMHKLGVQFVMITAERAIKNARNKDNPAPLFHFLINKEMNKKSDPYMPRFTEG